MNELSIPRSLWTEGDIIGRPILVVFSDGSVSAFGAAAYIRWQLVGGGYWSRLIMAKSKISPKNAKTIPRMELCGAGLGCRIKNFLLKETKFDFEKVYNLVDSSTVLGYLHKECGAFGPFKGVRVAEYSIFKPIRGRSAGECCLGCWCGQSSGLVHQAKDCN